MGISAAWIAVKGVDKVELFERLGVVETDETGEWSDFGLSWAETPEGWIVVHSEDFNYPAEERMAAVSRGGEAVGCAIEEHGMASMAYGYADSRRLWSVLHDPEKGGVRHLSVTGEPPPELEGIRDRLLAEQAEEDAGRAMTDHVFDAPAELVYTLCGFRADGAATGRPEPVMTALEQVRPVVERTSLVGALSRLFGRGR